jgi:predicted transposase YbfD/YdcC
VTARCCRRRKITRFAPLLEPLDLAGCVITADALHTQREHAEFLVTGKGPSPAWTPTRQARPARRLVASRAWCLQAAAMLACPAVFSCRTWPALA